MKALIIKCIARLTRPLLSKRIVRIRPIRPIYRPIYRPIHSVYFASIACGVSAGFASIVAVNTAGCRGRVERFYVIDNIKKEINVNEVIKSLKKADPHETHGIYTLEKVTELFHSWGVSDNNVIRELFNVADWEHNGVINQFQLSAILTLLHDDDATRQSMEEYLFGCLNLDKSGFIHKEAFRAIMVSLLMIKYQVFGLARTYNTDDANDDYYNIHEGAEMCGLAKFKANQMCKKVFAFADKTHSDKLYFQAFQYWWHHGGSDANEFHLPTDDKFKLKNTYLKKKYMYSHSR